MYKILWISFTRILCDIISTELPKSEKVSVLRMRKKNRLSAAFHFEKKNLCLYCYVSNV